MKVAIQVKTLSAGRKQYQLSYRLDGRRIQKTIPGAIFAEGDGDGQRAALTVAEAARDELLRDLDGQNPVAVLKRAAADPSVSATKREHLQRVARLWQEALPHVSTLSDIRADDIRTFVNLLRDRYKPNTVRSYISQLFAVLNLESRRGNMGADHLAALKAAAEKPAAEKDSRGFLSSDDLRRLLDTPLPRGIDPIVKDLFELAALTGLRYSDLIRLKPSNIVGKTIRLRMRKTAGTLTVPLTDRAVAILDGRMPRLFSGLPPVTTTINRALAKWSAAAGVAATRPDGSVHNVSVHCARHAFATRLLNRGATLEAVAALLGHKSISTTAAYAKVLGSTLIKTIGLL